VVQVVDQLDVAAQRFGNLGVERLEAEALGLGAEHVVQLLDRLG
jgi:hypothetical protein